MEESEAAELLRKAIQTIEDAGFELDLTDANEGPAEVRVRGKYAKWDDLGTSAWKEGDK